MRLFKRKTKPAETAPQLTRWQRSALAQPGTPSGPLAYAVYDEMQRDAMVQTALTIKRLAVLAADWTLEPSSPTPAAKAQADFVTEAFSRMEGSPNDVLNAAMDAFAKGWSVQELVYRPERGRVWLHTVRPKDPALFGLETDAFGAVTGLVLRVPGEVETRLPRAKFVVYAHRRGYSAPKGRSDLDAAHRHWSAKQSLVSAWRLHLEKFAMPTVLGKFERGLPAEEQSAVLRALQDIQNNTAVVFPSEIEIGLLGGAREAPGGFLDAIEHHNREIARAVLGQTLTTDEGRRVGSLALGRVHLQVLMLQVEALRRELADTVMTEQVVRPLVEANFGTVPPPRFRFKAARLDAFAEGRM